jgi:hypothetical protein
MVRGKAYIEGYLEGGLCVREGGETCVIGKRFIRDIALIIIADACELDKGKYKLI